MGERGSVCVCVCLCMRVRAGVELLKAEEGGIELADLILHIVIHKRAVWCMDTLCVCVCVRVCALEKWRVHQCVLVCVCGGRR